MYSVPSVDELSATLETNWETGFKVLPPKTSGKNGISTGSIMYTRTLDNGRSIDDQLAFMGPPCTMLSPIRDGRVLYPKISLNLNRKDGKTDEFDPKDAEYAKERDAFVEFVREMEAQTLKKVKENTSAFFGGKAISPDNVFIKRSLVDPEEDNYRTKLTCKVDLKEEANGAREDIDWNHIRIDVQDVKLAANGEVEWKKITLEDIAMRDKILPSFRSAYPYFEMVKNHRNGEMEGYCKIQWCLAGIQRIEKVHDMKRTRDDDEDGEGPSPAWMKKIKAYIKDKDDEAVTETVQEAVTETVQETVQEETVQEVDPNVESNVESNVETGKKTKSVKA
jgi:hypothetical protein